MGDQLLASRNWRGMWWHPSHPDEVVSGILTFSPDDGLHLMVIGVSENWGQFRGVFPGGDGEQTHWDVLNGIDDDARMITLCDVVLVKTGLRQVVTQEMIATRALVGCHLAVAEDAAFDRMETTIEGLGDFLRLREVESQSEMSVELPGLDLTAELWMRTSSSLGSSPAGVSLNRSNEVVFSATAARPRTASELVRAATTLEALISVLHQYPMRLITLRLRLNAVGAESGAPHDLQWVDAYQGLSAGHDRHRHRPGRPMLTSDSVAPAMAIGRWFQVMEEYRGSCQMLLTLLYEQTEFINPRVVTAVTAAEAMQSTLVKHSLMTEVAAMPDQTYEALVAAAVEAVPEEDRDPMRNLVRKNRAGLQGRLEALATGDDGQAIGHLLPDAKVWAANAAGARNKIAHGSVKSLKGIHNLRAVVETANAVVTLRLLERLGLCQADLREVVDGSKHLRWVRDLAHEEFPSGDPQ